METSTQCWSRFLRHVPTPSRLSGHLGKRPGSSPVKHGKTMALFGKNNNAQFLELGLMLVDVFVLKCWLMSCSKLGYACKHVSGGRYQPPSIQRWYTSLSATSNIPRCMLRCASNFESGKKDAWMCIIIYISHYIICTFFEKNHYIYM